MTDKEEILGAISKLGERLTLVESTIGQISERLTQVESKAVTDKEEILGAIKSLRTELVKGLGKKWEDIFN